MVLSYQLPAAATSAPTAATGEPAGEAARARRARCGGDVLRRLDQRGSPNPTTVDPRYLPFFPFFLDAAAFLLAPFFAALFFAALFFGAAFLGDAFLGAAFLGAAFFAGRRRRPTTLMTPGAGMTVVWPPVSHATVTSVPLTRTTSPSRVPPFESTSTLSPTSAIAQEPPTEDVETPRPYALRRCED